MVQAIKTVEKKKPLVIIKCQTDKGEKTHVSQGKIRNQLSILSAEIVLS